MSTAIQESPAKLRVTEIFYSLQGESRTVGLPTVFVRLTGCPLRCGYCDTEYAFHGGELQGIDDIIEQVARYHTRYVTVTGGEPLAQKPCLDLLKKLCDIGYDVSLETSGALDIKEVDRRVVIVMDLKTPGSGEQAKNRYDNLEHLKPSDQIKFVMCDENDYAWAKTMVVEHELARCCEILFSPSYQQLDATQLADWILADQLPVRMQVQLHKYLWGAVPGH
ncbi:MAG: queuosine biosynthesis protein QueE [Gammaproteobacteria bacterium]|nr:MAG: queuosine biosynthesis protein QueE [Gammaproteobacteria bacterium]TND04278.1 MAG: queuosine biosynthesis protein QueE [Gammaproteobacteria bacterium]